MSKKSTPLRRHRGAKQGGGAVSKESTQLRRTGVVLEGPPVQYSTKRVLSGEREQEQCRWRRCEEVYNHALSSSEVEWILIHSIHHTTSQYFSNISTH